MDRYSFSRAKAVFYPAAEAARDRAAHAVTHYGFYHSFAAPKAEYMTIAITAKNEYRLYVNGQMLRDRPSSSRGRVLHAAGRQSPPQI